MYICGGAKIEIVCIIMYLVPPNIKHIFKQHCDGTNIFSANFGLGLGEWILKGHVLISNVAKKNFQTFFSVPKNPNIFTSLMLNIHIDASIAEGYFKSRSKYCFNLI